ncbi:MAG: tryptophan--tRNA ligase [Deinococcus sp.]|nr:tryptophan--tRNA ligase [Deinococcus sp.]
MKGIVFSGMQPSGTPHIGNKLGALDNWVKMQDEYDCIYGIVDWHALTTGYEDPKEVGRQSLELAMIWLACGLDPQKSTLMLQSAVPEHAELHLLFSMFLSLPRLERIPTYKEKLREIEGRNLTTYGFLGYPVLQAADILIYKSTHVPVGKDQDYHLELTREVAEQFNRLYGQLFPITQTVHTVFPVLPGTDGRKMSKSYGNTSSLTDSEDMIKDKVRNMVTDPQRIKRTDPGRPEVCPVYAYYQAFAPQEAERTAHECRNALRGCVECKLGLVEPVQAVVRPVREGVETWQQQPDEVARILHTGSQQARGRAQQTVTEVREHLGLWQP